MVSQFLKSPILFNIILRIWIWEIWTLWIRSTILSLPLFHISAPAASNTSPIAVSGGTEFAGVIKSLNLEACHKHPSGAELPAPVTTQSRGLEDITKHSSCSDRTIWNSYPATQHKGFFLLTKPTIRKIDTISGELIESWLWRPAHSCIQIVGTWYSHNFKYIPSPPNLTRLQ